MWNEPKYYSIRFALLAIFRNTTLYSSPIKHPGSRTATHFYYHTLFPKGRTHETVTLIIDLSVLSHLVCLKYEIFLSLTDIFVPIMQEPASPVRCNFFTCSEPTLQYSLSNIENSRTMCILQSYHPTVLLCPILQMQLVLTSV
jgi:hypothetical protein